MRGGVRGEGREHSGGDRHPDDADRQHHHEERVVHRADRLVGDERGEEDDDQEVDLRRGEAHDARAHEAQHVADRLGAEVE